MISNRRLLPAAGLALIVLTNAVALGGVAWNRFGEPDSRMLLGERELLMPWRAARPDSENSGLSLELHWRCLQAPTLSRRGATWYDSNSPAWLDARKMAELGFDLRAPAPARTLDRAPQRHEQLPRDVWLVLELEGPAYRQALAEAAQAARAAASRAAEAAASQPASRSVARALDTRPAAGDDSRLFAVDAGLDRDALRTRYPDRTMYAIVHARVSPRRGSELAIDGGRIDALDIDEINVPLALRPVFDGMAPRDWRSRPSPGFDATVDFGRRAEPWLADARRTAAAR